uniref:Phytase-like domain-containing protein n=1 Tax=Ascaris lumbricoides TaxID=6252 RepID=A0A0M3IEB3_ASCLU
MRDVKEIICGILFSCVLVIHFVQRWSVLRIAAGQLKRPGAGLRACPKKGSNHFKEEAFYSTSTLADHYCLSSTFARNGKWSTRTFWRQLYLAALFFLVIPSESGSRPIVIRSPKGYDHIVTDSDGSTELYIFSEPNGLLNPMSGIATIGGGAASFQPVAALSVNLTPPFDYTGSHLLANCARQAQQLRRRRHEPRLEPRYDGPNREGALFCRSGTWVEILDRTTAEYEARRNDLTRPEYVRGTHNEHSRFKGGDPSSCEALSLDVALFSEGVTSVGVLFVPADIYVRRTPPAQSDSNIIPS